MVPPSQSNSHHDSGKSQFQLIMGKFIGGYRELGPGCGIVSWVSTCNLGREKKFRVRRKQGDVDFEEAACPNGTSAK